MTRATRMRALWTAAAAAAVTLMLIGCTPTEPPPAPADEAPPPPAAAAPATIGTISAQPEAADPTTDFGVESGIVCVWFKGVNILLSDRTGESVNGVGAFVPLSSDLEPPYHRLILTLDELPQAPGEYPVTGLSYSVHDATSGPFNYGWREVEGGLVLEEVAGTAEAGEGQVEGARLAGSFTVTNSRGGTFSGSFGIG